MTMADDVVVKTKPSKAAWDALAAIGAKVDYESGEEIFAEGEDGDSLVLLETGLVRVVRHAASGRASILAFLKGGDVIGEITCIARVSRSATVECVTPASAYRVRRSDVMKLFEQEFWVAQEFLEILCGRLHKTDVIAQRAGAQDMRAKLAGALRMLAEEHGLAQDGGIKVDLPITRSDFGAYAGLSRENVSRVFSDWKRSGLLTFGTNDRQVTILDFEALCDLSEEE